MDDDWGYLPVWETSIWILKLTSPSMSVRFSNFHPYPRATTFRMCWIAIWIISLFFCVSKYNHPFISPSTIENSQHGTCELKLGLDDIPILGVLWRELSDTKLTRPMLVYCIPLRYIWSMWGLWTLHIHAQICCLNWTQTSIWGTKLATACVTHTSLRSFYAVQRLPSGTETFDV